MKKTINRIVRNILGARGHAYFLGRYYRIAKLATRINPWKKSRRRTVLREYDGHLFNLYRHSHVEQKILRHGGLEETERLLFRHVVQPGSCVMDIGANCGIHTVLFSKLVGDAGVVFAFEPVGYNQRKLQANLVLNGCRNVMVFPIALGDAPGQAKLREVREDAVLTGNSSLVDNEKLSTVLRYKIEIKTVEVDTIDNIVERHGVRVALIKMDVEGYEYSVLLGARNTISKQCPILILEHNPARISFLGLSHRDFADLLSPLYDCYEICDPDESDDHPSLEPFAFDRDNRHDNLLCIPKWNTRLPFVSM